MYYTERLMLRSLDIDADKGVMLQWMNDVDAGWAMTMDAPRPTNRDQVKKMLEKIMDKDDGLPCFGVCEKPADDPETLDTHDDLFLKDGKSRYPLIGVLHFYATPFKFVHSSTQFGIMFDKKHQGQGYGTELLRWGMDYVFNSLDLHKCELRTLATNARAIKCYEKVGFVREGQIRESAFRNGKWEDVLLMGLLQREWQQSSR